MGINTKLKDLNKAKTARPEGSEPPKIEENVTVKKKAILKKFDPDIFYLLEDFFKESKIRLSEIDGFLHRKDKVLHDRNVKSLYIEEIGRAHV